MNIANNECSMVSDIIFLWSGSDFIVIGFVLLIPTMILLDIRFDITVFFKNKFGLGFERESLLAFFLFVLSFVFMFFEYDYSYISKFLSIIEYSDPCLTILRPQVLVVIFYLITLFSLLFSLVCGVYAYKKNLPWIRWIVFGFLVNVFAFFYLRAVVERKAQGGGGN